MLGFHEKGHMIFNKNAVDITTISHVLMTSRKMYRPDTTTIIIIDFLFYICQRYTLPMEYAKSIIRNTVVCTHV